MQMALALDISRERCKLFTNYLKKNSSSAFVSSLISAKNCNNPVIAQKKKRIFTAF